MSTAEHDGSDTVEMRFVKEFSRTGGILAAIALGMVFPQAHVLDFLIRYLIMVMLLLVFLRMRRAPFFLHSSHFFLVAANLAIGPFAFWLVRSCGGGHDLALASFFVGVTPTAAAAPVVMTFLDGREEYVTSSFLLTTGAAALGLPLMLPLFLGVDAQGLCGHVFRNLLFVLGAPVTVALLTRKFYRPSPLWLARLGNLSFLLWTFSLFLISAATSNFLRDSLNNALRLVVEVCAATMLICALNFSLGYLLGGRRFKREASQSLGQKNTTLTIYLALSYANPAVALGPACYVFWHNLWNAVQLYFARLKIGRED